MRSVYKYEVNLYGNTPMPKGAVVRHVGVQNNVIHVWAEVDTAMAQGEERRLRVYGTGHPLPDVPLVYLGTAHLHQDQLIFHVYEELI